MKKFYVSVTAELVEEYTITAKSVDEAMDQAARLMQAEYKVQRVFTDGSAPIATGFDSFQPYGEEE
jgi:hypothetical protein